MGGTGWVAVAVSCGVVCVGSVRDYLAGN
jgi:hypothetical protein